MRMKRGNEDEMKVNRDEGFQNRDPRRERKRRGKEQTHTGAGKP